MLTATTQQHYRELAAGIAHRHARSGWRVVGLCGAQGSGKSTAARFLQDALLCTHGLRSAILSLDDFYRSRAARQQLAQKVHPLFATRGVPGTHDPALGLEVLQKLLVLGVGQSLPVPTFSKAQDDPLPLTSQRRITGPLDLVLFEGWCVGLPPQSTSELSLPVNTLEAREDGDARWRRAVNQQLAGAYAEWFARIDGQVFLRVPDLDCVRRWRWAQEQQTALAAGGHGAGLMTREQIDRFIQHYERLSLHALRVMPHRAHAVLDLDPDHAVGAPRWVDQHR